MNSSTVDRRDGPHRLWRLRSVFVVAVLLIGASGIAASRGPTARTEEVAVPLLEGAYRVQGRLADGLEIPAGAVLLGSPLPVGPATGSESVTGWRGLFLVQGDLEDLLRDLEAQAAGIGLQPQVLGGRFPSCRVAHRGHAWLCEATWQHEATYLSMLYTRGLVPPDHTYGRPDLLHTQQDRPISLLVLNFGQWRSDGSRTVGRGEVPTVIPCLSTRLSLALSQPVTTPPGFLPGGWTEPPRPGQGLGDGIIANRDPHVVSLRIPEGAEAVVAPWPNNAQVPSYGAILAVSGDLDTVWRSLTEQVRSRVPVVDERRGRQDGHDVRRLWGANDENGNLDCYELEAVTANGRSWIAVFTGYDVRTVR